MSMKRESPPPRPPAPKLSLGKLKGKQNSTGSIAIRFSASSMADDDDLDDDLSIGGRTELVHFEISRDSEESPERRSQSVPVSEAASPVSSPGQMPSGALQSPVGDKEYVKVEKQDLTGFKEVVKDKEKSLFSGIKEKISDKIHDPLTAFIEKIEELSGDSSPEDGKEQKFKKSDSLDSSKSSPGTNLAGDSKDKDRREAYLASLKSHSRNSSVESENSVGESMSENNTPSKSRADSFEMVDDFYGAEPFEDFTGGFSMSRSSSKSSLGRSPSSEQLQTKTGTSPQKSKLPFQKFMKTKHSGGAGGGRPVSMSLSGLLSNKENEIEEFEEEGVEFYDPHEENLMGTEERTGGASATQGYKSDFPGAVPWQKIVILTICLFVYLIVPLPTYMSGMVAGAAIAYSFLAVYNWIHAPPKAIEPFILPDLKTLPPLDVPVMKESKNEDGKFKGWLNELGQYNPEDYHINQTTSVYLQLEGTILRLQRPKHNIPKRAMWDEQSHNPTFIHQRHFDLLGSHVYLLPSGLVKKRVWSKKYPICINLAKSGSKWEKKGSCEGDLQQLAKGFEEVAGESCTEPCLYLFARTGREKEEWYRRLKAATEGVPLPTRMSDLIKNIELPRQRRSSSSSIEPNLRHRRQGSTDSISSNSSDKETPESDKQEHMLTEYMIYMSKSMPDRTRGRGGPNREVRPGSGLPQLSCEPQVIWVNALLGRLFWDFLREKYWAEKMKDKIQRKLSKIHVPYFIDELVVTGIELGCEIPIIRRASKPYLDDRGLWVDVDIAYNGGFRMSLETKVNLMKLKKKHSHRQDEGMEKKSPVTDSDEEDSAESSTDEEAEENPIELPEEPGANHSASTSKKLLRIVDKITQSKYFQQATEYKYIKQAMEQVSNTPLMLTVELRSVVGTLAVNIPPPPTDRVWYGFRNNPRLWLSAKPKVGERAVTVTHVTEWIEKKLSIEFQRILVMPNMDDIPIPLMCDQTEPDPLNPRNDQS